MSSFVAETGRRRGGGGRGERESRQGHAGVSGPRFDPKKKHEAFFFASNPAPTRHVLLDVPGICLSTDKICALKNKRINYPA